MNRLIIGAQYPIQGSGLIHVRQVREISAGAALFELIGDGLGDHPGQRWIHLCLGDNGVLAVDHGLPPSQLMRVSYLIEKM